MTRKDLSEPIFCSICGCRIGWRYENSNDDNIYYCDDCVEGEFDEEYEDVENIDESTGEGVDKNTGDDSDVEITT